MILKRAFIAAMAMLLITTGVVAAVGFVSTLQANGAWNRHELRSFVDDVKALRGLNQSSVRVVEVNMTTETGWHSHPGAPSLLIVESGTMDLIEPTRDGACKTTTLPAGAAISHPTSTHNLVRAEGSPPVVFTVVYFSKVAAPLLHVDPVNSCTTGDDDE